MIVTSNEMRAIEAASGDSVEELMLRAGTAVAEQLSEEAADTRFLILCGKGNNGGDGFVAANLLKDRYTVQICCLQGQPTTDAAKQAYDLLDKNLVVTKNSIHKAIRECDVIVDAVYGFGYHGLLNTEMKQMFREINLSGKKVYSIDLNSGCEADTGKCDLDALRSDITLALDCYKPFHMLRKNHGMFREVRLLDLGLPHPETSTCRTMNEELFFRNFPRKGESSYKGTFGKTTLIGGSYGMAGAACLNLLGARTVGASYIQMVMPEEIYPLVAPKYITSVFKPINEWNWKEVILPLIEHSSSIAFGSGCVNMPAKDLILDLILQNASGPVVLDAEALRLLTYNTYILRFAKVPVILTPHIGEFASMLNLPKKAIDDNYMEAAIHFAKENKVTLVLKKPNTVVVSPTGEVYINQSGNSGLAQAGSGDLLTGILTGILGMTKDVFTAVCMGVWLHGYLCELGTANHSRQLFDLERFPEIMDELFVRHGF